MRPEGLPVLRRTAVLQAEALLHVERAQVLRHVAGHADLFICLAVQLKPPPQVGMMKRRAHLVRRLANLQAQRVHQRFIRRVAAAAPAQPVRPEAPVHAEALAPALARVAPAEPDVIPEWGFVLREARIPADAAHRPPRPHIQPRVDELNDRRHLVAERAQRLLDELLIASAVLLIKRLVVVEADVGQKIDCLLRKTLKQARSSSLRLL